MSAISGGFSYQEMPQNIEFQSLFTQSLTHRGKSAFITSKQAIWVSYCSNGTTPKVYENQNTIWLCDANEKVRTQIQEMIDTQDYSKIQSVKGAFSVVIYHRKTQEIILIRDKFALK